MTEPAWVTIAKGYNGVKEIPGPKHNSVISKWLEKLNAWWRDDETPWCGTFVAICLRDAGLGIVKNWFRALAWAKYGVEVSPRLGAILVFQRSGGGHVGFYAGEDATRYFVLGGNQKNQVTYSWLLKERLVSCRWPAGVPVPNTGRVMLAGNGQPTSTNEA